MGGLLLGLLPLIQAAVGGESIATALSALTVAQWVTLAADVANAAPQLIAAMKALHPALKDFLTDIENGANKDLAAHGVHATLAAWLKQNGDAAIKLQPGAAGQ